MEQAATAEARKPLNQNYLSPEKDKPRGQSLVRMKVVNRNTHVLSVLENVIGPGEHVITVYKGDVPKVMERVESEPDRIALAEEMFEREIAELVIGQLDRWDGTVEDMLPVMRSRSDTRINEIHDRLMQTTSKSVEGTFQKLTKRALKPLVSAEVIKDSEHAEPQRTALNRETEKLAEAIGAALDKRMSGGAPSQADINALVDARVKELLGEKAAGKSR